MALSRRFSRVSAWRFMDVFLGGLGWMEYGLEEIRCGSARRGRSASRRARGGRGKNEPPVPEPPCAGSSPCSAKSHGSSLGVLICRLTWSLSLVYLRQPVAGYAQKIIENEKYDKNYLSKVTTFFQRLEIALSARGKSKSALASHLSMALSGISRWRDSIPRAERVQEITTWLNVSGKWLMTGEGEMYPVKIGEKKPGDVFRSGEVKEFPPPVENNFPVRMIPVIGWAHAGDPENYEEIPDSWQERVPTECRDPKAFAVRLEGDSMGPAYAEGDLLIVQPGEEIYSGCLAVIKMHSDGYVFRRIEIRKVFLRLIPLNPQWPAEELPTSDIAWAYPLYGMWRQVWKR